MSKIWEPLPTKGNLFHDLISDSESMRLFLRGFAIEKAAHCNEVLLASLMVETYEAPDGYVIMSNIHPSAIVPGHFAEGWQNLLPMIHDYQNDLRLAQSRSADIICGEVNSRISSARLDLSINRATKTQADQTAFEEFVFAEARPFGKAFDDGIIDLRAALQIIDETAQFREWLSGIPVDRDLVKEFHEAVNKKTVLDKLPGRTSRFAFFSGAGALFDAMGGSGLGTVAGIGLSAFDNFVLDGLLKGWKPNNFVEKVKSATDRP